MKQNNKAENVKWKTELVSSKIMYAEFPEYVALPSW